MKLSAQDLLNDNVTYADFDLGVVPYVTLPSNTRNIISMTTQPGFNRLFVSTQEGVVYAVDPNSDGQGTASTWIDVNQTLLSATGRGLNFQNPPHGGLRAIAFHPNFANPQSAGYGKFYASVMHNRPNNPSNHFYLGDSNHGNGVSADSALFEFTYDFTSQNVNPNSTRELFRVNMPVFDHPIKQIKFNNRALPGDEDYGLLYIAHGDGSVQSATAGGGQNTDDVLGKILRINPIQNGASPYSVPPTNPFVGQPGTLGEIYASGFRNPHTFSFNKDNQGNTYFIGADAGRDNIEEINFVVAGRNYGWSEREGTFRHLSSGGFINGVATLPANEAATTDFVYPVAQIDHNTGAISTDPGDGFVGFAIVSGHVIKNPVDQNLNNLFFYSNFGAAGDMFFTHFDEMQNTVIDLNPADPSRDHPSELSWADSHLIRVALDDDNNPGTAPIIYENFNQLLGTARSETRFGEGPFGEMYVSSKINGTVYLVSGSMPNQLLRLTIDRSNGAASITSDTGAPVEVDGISLQSMSGSLLAENFQSMGAGWTSSASNDSSKLTQLIEGGSQIISDTLHVSLGNVFNPTPTAFGIDPSQDVQFQYTGPNGSSLGRVVYLGQAGVPYTIVLTIDVTTGDASLLNQTPFEQEVEAYRIASPSGSLNPAGWNTLEAQGADDGDWSAGPALATQLLELQEDGTTTFNNTTPYGLGEIASVDGLHDITFEFLLAGGDQLSNGQVIYILAGDYNDDGKVDAADYTVWRDHIGSTERLPNDMTPGMVTSEDYAIWKDRFGASLNEASAGSGQVAQVPEPVAMFFGLQGLLSLLFVRRGGPSGNPSYRSR